MPFGILFTLLLLYLLKICRAVLAQRTNEIIGQRFALVDVSADLANVALLAVCLGLGLYVFMVVCVGHRLAVRDDSRFINRADEHAVRAEINVVLHGERHCGVDILGKYDQTVVRADGGTVFKLVRVASALEAKGLKYRKGRVYRQAVDVHFARLLYGVVRVIGLVDCNRNARGIVRNLRNGVDDQSVVLLTVVGGYYVKSVSQFEEC